jgi:hypothetical protein
VDAGNASKEPSLGQKRSSGRLAESEANKKRVCADHDIGYGLLKIFQVELIFVISIKSYVFFILHILRVKQSSDCIKNVFNNCEEMIS